MTFSLSSWKKSLLRAGLMALALATAGATLSGCVMLPGMGHEAKTLPNGAPLAHAVAIHTYWDRELQSAPDPTKGGEKGLCLVGRMILLGHDGKAICSDGKLIVTLYDEHPPQGGPAVAVEDWHIDNENLNKLIKKDALKLWGYTLVLPTAWGPNLQQARVELKFEPADSHDPLHASSGAFFLNTNNMPSMSISSRTATVPGTIPAPGQPTSQGPNAAGQPQQSVTTPSTTTFVPGLPTSGGPGNR